MKNKISQTIGFFTVLLMYIPFTGLAQNGLKPGLNTSFKIADSFFLAKEWKHAKMMYESLLTDTSRNALAWMRLGFSNYNLGDFEAGLKCYKKSLASDPVPVVKGVTLWRMAKLHAMQNERQKAFVELDSAVNIGYTNLPELDTLNDFNNLRSDTRFKELRQKVYVVNFPCMADPHAREFDFWIGDWDVYVTGTKVYAGHNTIQMISGGCALLENWENSAGTGKSINYIEPSTNKWKQAWAGSYAGGIQEFVNGEYKDSAMHFVFETKDAQGNKQTGRFIFFNEGPNQVRQFNETSGDGGKTWATSYDFTYIRKK